MPRLLLSSVFVCAALGASPLHAQRHVCTVTAAGEGCAPLSVTIIPQGNSGGHDLTLTATGLHPKAHGAMIWGMEPIAVPVVPASLCPLLTDYVWGRTFTTDQAGTYTWSRNWPASFHGWFYMQMGSVRIDGNGNLDVITTQCRLVQCLLP